MIHYFTAAKKYFILFFVFVSAFCICMDSQAEQSNADKNGKVRMISEKDAYISLKGGLNGNYFLSGIYQEQTLTYSLEFYVFDSSRKNDSISVESGDRSTVSVSNVKSKADQLYCDYTFDLTISNYCDTLVTITCGNETYTIRCRFLPKSATVTGFTPAGKNSVCLNINQVIGADGYYVLQRDNGWWKEKELVKGNTGSIKINTQWISDEVYVVCPAIQYSDVGKYNMLIHTYFTANGRRVSDEEFTTAIAMDPNILSGITPDATIDANGIVTVSWKGLDGPLGYRVYTSTLENGTYTLLQDAGRKLSAVDQLTAGQTKYYYVEAVYSDDSIMKSKSISITYATNSNIAVASRKLGRYSTENISYSEDASFVNGNQYTLVSKSGSKKIRIETINLKSGKRKNRKITVGSYDYLGGAFKLDDGNQYVVIGKNNLKESKKKIVIKVIQYNSNWKKLGECKIKSNAANEFAGIVTPFDAGNVDMSYSDGYAYLKTARLMFRQSDGLNHQSNIQFVINTKKMTYRCAEECYVSHSFAQYVAEKDGSVYQADLGDAYPRSLAVTITDYYTPETGKDEVSNCYDVMSFKGGSGDNFVNASLKGLEVGKDNVLTCGTSAPHYQKVAGVKGWKLNENVYIGVTDRRTGESHVVWLTKNDPKKKNYCYKVMLFSKVNDDRFAILYSKENVKKETYEIYCAVVDNSGNIIKNICVRNCSESVYDHISAPAYSNGSIVWVEPVYKKKKITKKWYGQKYTYTEEKHVNNMLYIVDVLLR